MPRFRQASNVEDLTCASSWSSSSRMQSSRAAKSHRLSVIDGVNVMRRKPTSLFSDSVDCIGEDRVAIGRNLAWNAPVLCDEKQENFVASAAGADSRGLRQGFARSKRY